MTDTAVRSVDEVAACTLVLPASVCVPLPPRFAFGTFPASVASTYYKAMELHEIGVYAGEFAWSDGFVIDADGGFVVGAKIQLLRHLVGELEAERKARLLSAPIERLRGPVAILCPPSRAHRIYGHWLVDMLPKLAVLQAAGHDLQALWYPVPADIPRFGLELMTLFGIPQDRIVRVAKGCAIAGDVLLMPTLLHNGVRCSSLLRDAVALFRRGIDQSGHDASVTSGPARIFLARKDNKRLVTNRARIEAMARAAGFEVVHPETRTLPEQIAMFSSAREIVGEYGSAFHTAMFSPAGTIVCGLRGGQFHPAFIQSGMGEVLDQPTGYVFGEPHGDPARYDYTVSEEDFADCLKTVFDRKAGLAVRATPKPLEAPARSAREQTQKAGRQPVWRRVIDRFSSRTSAFEPVAPPSDDPPPAGGPSLSPSVPELPIVYLAGHLQNQGDTQAGPDGWLGLPGSALAIEGVKISFGPGVPAGLRYQVMSEDGSLCDPVRAGLYCGTRGKGAPVFGFVLRAEPDFQAMFTVAAEAHFRDQSHSGPVNPEVVLRAATPSPLTALRVTVQAARS